MIAAACPGANMVVQNKYASRKPIFMSGILYIFLNTLTTVRSNEPTYYEITSIHTLLFLGANRKILSSSSA
jgi:hypothetical protein